MKSMTYQAFELSIQSHLPLSGLPSLDSDLVDIEISEGPVEHGGATGSTAQQCLRADARAVVLSDLNSGVYAVREGSYIIVDAHEGAAEASIRDFLLGPALAVALHQRGYLVLHGSAVTVGGRGAAILGASGRGKSTTAAALLARGHGFVADDIVCVDLSKSASGAIELVSGFPAMNLWSDSQCGTQGAVERPLLFRNIFDKGSFSAHDAFAAGRVSLERVYVLEIGQMPGITPTPDQLAVARLFDHSFGPEFMRFGQSTPILAKCGEVVSRVGVRSLTRSTSFDHLAKLVDLIESDLGYADAGRAFLPQQ